MLYIFTYMSVNTHIPRSTLSAWLHKCSFRIISLTDQDNYHNTQGLVQLFLQQCLLWAAWSLGAEYNPLTGERKINYTEALLAFSTNQLSCNILSPQLKPNIVQRENNLVICYISCHIHNLKGSCFLTLMRAQPGFVQPLWISSSCQLF